MLLSSVFERPSRDRGDQLIAGPVAKTPCFLFYFVAAFGLGPLFGLLWELRKMWKRSSWSGRFVRFGGDEWFCFFCLCAGFASVFAKQSSSLRAAQLLKLDAAFANWNIQMWISYGWRRLLFVWLWLLLYFQPIWCDKFKKNKVLFVPKLQTLEILDNVYVILKEQNIF